jgi:hypothetical protein
MPPLRIIVATTLKEGQPRRVARSCDMYFLLLLGPPTSSSSNYSRTTAKQLQQNCIFWR